MSGSFYPFLHLKFIIFISNDVEGIFAAIHYTLCLLDMLGKKLKRVLVRSGLLGTDNTTINGFGTIKTMTLDSITIYKENL